MGETALVTQERSGPGPVGENAEPGTRTDIAATRLRAAILNGTLLPGTRLLPGELADQLGLNLSQTPFREAIMRLAEQGFVDTSNHRGATVAVLRTAELDEIYELRMMLEPLAMKRSVQNGDDAWRGHIRARAQVLKDVKEASYFERDAPHRALHVAMLSRCDSAWLLRLVMLLFDNSSRYRANARRSVPSHPDRHGPTVEACLAGEADLAAKLCREHISNMYTLARAALE
jgi:GntR family transcriptional regulator, carbon starvation induced regulator